ncbi:MAG TPA: LLM class flavin-dependent oxidoreductase, partial [Ilumatobacteraceae bacterium]|nr:LLM class flavin-dependent oxidoreductase [Ilumatobacteraceae bacterium]
LALVLGRLTGATTPAVALALPTPSPDIAPLFAPTTPLTLDGTAATAADALAAAATSLAAAQHRGAWLLDVIARSPELAGRAEFERGMQLPVALRLTIEPNPVDGALVVVQAAAHGWQVAFDTGAVRREDAQQFADCLDRAASHLVDGQVSLSGVPLLDEATRTQVLVDWNDTRVEVDTSRLVHELVAAQAARTPDRVAVECIDETVTYRELLERATALASTLQEHGVGPDSLVAIHIDRSVDLVVAVVGVLLAGGAYVPLDPAYPADRLQHMIADSGTTVIVCQSHSRSRLPLPDDGVARTLVCIDEHRSVEHLRSVDTRPEHLAYCIYTSGSTGVPKGVLVEHRNVVNFFAGMDVVVLGVDQLRADATEPGTWFAVTSLSFDISVLELLYTLTRGFSVVVHVDSERGSPGAARSSKKIDFSLFYFSGDEAEGSGPDKYRLLLEGARFADANGFVAVWTPERHFHAFGGLYPQPAVTAAAVAAVTEHVHVRAGSVVLPLHHPVEVAEAWSVVDNLSNGRVGVAFASGWQPNDFIFRPDNYANAKEVMFESIQHVQRLWRGETIEFPGPDGMSVPVATLPRPVQRELPVWVTTAGNPETFEQAGAAGANLLTHLLGQSVEQVAPKIAAYRAARAAAGHDPATGVVTLMLHTFVGECDDEVQAAVREPLKQYLHTSFNLVREYAWSFPAFRRPDGTRVEQISDLADDDVAELTPDELDAVLEYAFQRYYQTSGLFGTPDSVVEMAGRVQAIGVDEIACLLDFGCPTEVVLAALPHLAEARRRCNPDLAVSVSERSAAKAAPLTIAEQIAAAGVTHLQCTPSMAQMLTGEPASRAALAGVPHLFIGGEAMSPALAGELLAVAGGSVTNMYGPTETTIWSTTWPLRPGFDWVPIGTPIANTQIYVLDADLQPQPPGVAGDLWIGGDGVVRGYHERPTLTAERFRADPFRPRPDGQGPHRMYFTGDRARWRRQPDGTGLVEFLGRSDHQVKLRGYRIELGEVEAHLVAAPGVKECVAIVHNDASGEQLVAYVVPRHHAAVDPRAARELMRNSLPEVMVPAHVIVLPSLPLTPNGKLDRAALPPPQTAERAAASASPPSSETERVVVQAWRDVLAVEAIGIDDNFFDIGGHSLLVVRLHRVLQERIGRPLPLTDLYRHPTVRTFAASLTAPSEGEPAAISAALDRAARRRNTLRIRGG